MILNGRMRKDFAKIRRVMEIPNLIDIQKKSYEGFLQRNYKPEERSGFGLQGVFKSVFPIKISMKPVPLNLSVTAWVIPSMILTNAGRER